MKKRIAEQLKLHVDLSFHDLNFNPTMAMKIPFVCGFKLTVLSSCGIENALNHKHKRLR